MPRVTVFVPSYNYGRYLPAALDSVLDQSYDDFELIVFDDGSTDDSYEIAQRYAARDARVRVLHHPGRENRGVGATVAAAFEASQGEFVSVLPADDTLLPQSLARRVSALDSRPDASCAYGLIEMLDEEGTTTGELIGTPPDMLERTYGTSDPLVAVLIHSYMPGHTVLARRDVLARAGGIDSELLYSDWDAAVKLHAHGPAVFVAAPPVAGHRDHDESMSLSAAPSVQLARRLAVFRSLDAHADAIGGRLRAPRIRAFVSLERAYYAFASNLPEEAHAALAHALAVDPSLATDPDYLLWWIGPHQYAGRATWFPAALERTRAAPDAVVTMGARQGDFASWAVETARAFVADGVLTRLRWGVIANELEARGPRPQPRALLACLVRAYRAPGSLRERWFVKAVVAAAGLWTPALRLRARLGARAGGR